MDERRPDHGYPQVDTSPTEHEREVAEANEGEKNPIDDPTADPGRRPTSDEDLTADKDPDR